MSLERERAILMLAEYNTIISAIKVLWINFPQIVMDLALNRGPDSSLVRFRNYACCVVLLSTPGNVPGWEIQYDILFANFFYLTVHNHFKIF